jgi:glycine C-acetyltransferase
MYGQMKDVLTKELDGIREAGLYKDERLILSPQAAEIRVNEGDVINFCANNYLGLSSHSKVIEAAHAALDEWGYGLSSVRFICGTQDIHKRLEKTISEFFGTDDSILYTSCFDANGGLFETLLTKDDLIISDALNHASIIDGVRLCKAERKRYDNSDMAMLEEILKECDGKHRLKMIATDGVFSMDGYIAKLDKICDLADKYDALVMVDDSHATGFVGRTGRGTPEHHGVMESIAAFHLIGETTELRDRLEENTRYFRQGMTAAGFEIKQGIHPIVPIMLGDAKLAQDIARDMLEKGIYVIGFSYPVVPKGQARIRVQVSAAHEKSHLDMAIAGFTEVGKRHGVIG